MERFFGIDLRGLGAMRITLGAILLYDLAVRARSLELFLTDEGALTIAKAIELNPLGFVPSVHLLSGAWGFQAFLLVLHALAALALLVGFHTRVAVAACWYLTVSLHFRNEMVLNGGDYLLRWILFWSLFLPLGARFSLPEYRARKSGVPVPAGSVANVATAGLMFQLCVMYWGSAMNKELSLWLSKPSGLYYALNLDPFTSSLGYAVREATFFLGVLTVLVYFLEWVAPLLIITGVTIARTVGVALLIVFHLGVAVLMQVGLFWVIPLAVLIALLPIPVWNKLAPEGNGQPVSSALPTAIQVFLGTIILVIPYLNLSLLKPELLRVPLPLYKVYRTLGLHYGWNMFARPDENIDGWFIVEAELENGSNIDLLTAREVTENRPLGTEMYADQRWRRYLVDLYRPGGEPYLQSFASCRARDWVRRGGSPIKQIRIYYMMEPTPEKPGTVEIEKRLLTTFIPEATGSGRGLK